MIITNWNSVPDYDEWGSDSYWDCDHWMQWHGTLKKKFGKERAKYIWEYSYEQGSSLSKHWDCRSFNREFRNFVAREGLDPYKSTPLALIIRPIGIGTDILGGAFDVVEGLGRNTKLIIGIGLSIGVAYYGFKLYNSVKEK